jgi:hypothetical protein
MTITRSWLGGGNNTPATPADWSVFGAPQPGDKLLVTGPLTQPFQPYTMNVYGNGLAGDTINTLYADLTLNDYSAVPVTVSDQSGSDTFNLANGSTLNLTMAGFTQTYGGSATVNITGHAHLKLIDGGHTTVNFLGTHARWTGTFDVSGYHSGALTINNGQNALFVNNGASSVEDFASVVVPTAVLGTGTFSVSSGARLEFLSGPGAGQTITVDSTAGSGGGKLVLDHARQFAGEVVLGVAQPIRAAPEIDILGLGAAADSYSFTNDMLSLYKGNTVLDTMHLHNTDPNGFLLLGTTAGGGGATLFGLDGVRPINDPSVLPVHV